MKNSLFKIRSLYLCVKDMDRAISFYENFFEQNPLVCDKIYSIFDINGFRLGLFAFNEVKEPHIYGNNCLPSIEVDNIDILKNKLKSLDIAFPITQIGSNWVCEFKDSEGNSIEITVPIK